MHKVMTRLPIFLFFLCGFILPAQAQEPVPAADSTASPAAVPEYLYCQIIHFHMPTTKGESVVFDFGQETGFWKYNVLTDSLGRDLVFNSGIQALNYMTARGWEFVQAWSSGEENQKTHMLLRIPASELPEETVAAALAAPRSSRNRAAWKEEEERPSDQQ